MRRVSPLLFRQHLSLRLPEACTHEVGRSIRNHTTSSLRNHRISIARYRFYTRAKTLALCPLGIRVFAVEGLSSAFLLKKTGSRPSSLPCNNVYSITIYILISAKQAVEQFGTVNLLSVEHLHNFTVLYLIHRVTTCYQPDGIECKDFHQRDR